MAIIFAIVYDICSRSVLFPRISLHDINLGSHVRRKRKRKRKCKRISNVKHKRKERESWSLFFFAIALVIFPREAMANASASQVPKINNSTFLAPALALR